MLYKKITIFIAALLLSGCFSKTVYTPADNSRDEAISAGERIYRQGILPSGKPVQAYVQTDIPIDGSMFSCESCHRRSGLGTIESYVIVPPVNGDNLYRPKARWDTWRRHSSDSAEGSRSRPVPELLLGKDIRPAYDDKTLARVIRTGKDSADRQIDMIMPVYDLSDRDMDSLIHYLKRISTKLSPGVTDETLRFATVISDGVSSTDRDAMLDVLKIVIKDRNAQTRNELGRMRSGSFTHREADRAYRSLILDVWELKGPRDTWMAQLQEYYEKEPVFAMLGGIVEGDWSPVHNFSEQNGIPCIFPITDMPVVSSSDWNTLYFSKGLYQEGEAAARYLRSITDNNNNFSIVQVYRDGTDGEVVARGFNDTWSRFNRSLPVTHIIPDQRITLNTWETFIQKERRTIILFWSGKEDVLKLQEMKEFPEGTEAVFLSAGLVGDDLSIVPDGQRELSFITYPYSIPRFNDKYVNSLKLWLKVKKVPASNIKIQSKMYFLGWMMGMTLMEMRSEFYRDYFLEAFDMMVDQSLAIAVYPRLSFGPGQRYVSKGCYIVKLTKGAKPLLIRKNRWVNH